MAQEKKKVYQGRVEEVYSGDDIIVMIDLGVEDLHRRQRIRLYGVDTPNAVNEGQSTEAGTVRAYVRGLLRGKNVEITVMSRGGSSWVAVVVLLHDGTRTNINDALIAQGYKYNKEKTHHVQ